MEDEFDFLSEALKGNEHNAAAESAATGQDVQDAIIVSETIKLKSGEEVHVKNGIYMHPKTGKPTFAPGNKVRTISAEKAAELKSNLKEIQKIQNWDKLSEFIDGRGIERFIEEMQLLNGRDYISAYLGILPFAKPKIANVEVKVDKSAEKRDKKNTHTVTIRDMRDGTELTIK